MSAFTNDSTAIGRANGAWLTSQNRTFWEPSGLVFPFGPPLVGLLNRANFT